MLKYTKISLFALFMASIVCVLIGNKANGMSIEGIDEHGRRVRVYDVEKYLKKEPYKAPRSAKVVSKSKPAMKKPVAKKPIAKKDDRCVVSKNELDRIVEARVKKELQRERAKEKAKHPSFEEANKEAIRGFVQGAIIGAITSIEIGGAGMVPGAAVGAASGYVGYALEHIVLAD